MRFRKLFVLCATIVFALSLQAQTSNVTVSFNYERVKAMASNQFAVWIEDANGNFIKTLYVTKFTGNGGYKKRPDSLPQWADKHTKNNIDTVTKATPSTSAIKCTWDFTDSNGKALPRDQKYMFFIEGTTSWKDNVFYSGTINPSVLGAIKVNVAYSTTKAKKSNMIKNVRATLN